MENTEQFTFVQAAAIINAKFEADGVERTFKPQQLFQAAKKGTVEGASNESGKWMITLEGLKAYYNRIKNGRKVSTVDAQAYAEML